MTDAVNDFKEICQIEKPVPGFSPGSREGLKAIFLSSSAQIGSTGHTPVSARHQFRILTVRSPSCLRLQSFDAEFRSKSFQCAYEIDGTISGYELHPSGAYLVVTSTQGFYYIFRVETGELRGKVPIMSNPKGLSIDPSGLYLAVSVPSNSENTEVDRHSRWSIQPDEAVNKRLHT